MLNSVDRSAPIWQRLLSLSTAAVLLLTALAVGGTTPAAADDNTAVNAAESLTESAPTQREARDDRAAEGGQDPRVTPEPEPEEGPEPEPQPQQPQPEPEALEFTVTVAGTARFGATLTASTSGTTETDRLTYQWLRGSAPIAGATRATYVPQVADVGQRLQVRVSGVRGADTVVRSSSATAPVATIPLTATKPAISGSAIVGSTLTAKPGTWTVSGVKFSYQWYRNGAAIRGATQATMKLGAADAGRTISVRVTGTKPGYTAAASTSAKTAQVLRTFSASQPKIGGTVKVGSTVSATVGTWKPKASKVTYQWNRNGSAIRGATQAKYRITSADAGRKLTVTVRGMKSGYAAAAKTSAAKSVPRVLQAGTATVSGSAKVGSTLRAGAGAWGPKPVTLKFQWKRSGKNISGATKSTYRVAAGDRGHRISVTVTGSKSGYTTASRTSGQTGKVTYPNRTAPSSSWNCPTWAPIKGNASSMIYHVPGGAYYSRTKPEECFTTESAARQAGYRASKR